MHAGEVRFRTLAEYRDQIRQIVGQGHVDIMLMSASNTERLSDEGLFRDSPVTAAIRANDTTDIWGLRGGRYKQQLSVPFRTASLDLRYVGQEHHLTVPVRVDEDRFGESASAIEQRFAERYLRTFGNAPKAEVEVVAVRAEIRRELRDEASLSVGVGPGSGDAHGSTRAFSLRANEWRDFALVHRSSMTADERVKGPALIVEGTTVSCLDSGYEAWIGDLDAVRIARTHEDADVSG